MFQILLWMGLTAFAGEPTKIYPNKTILPDDHHVEMRFKPLQADPLESLRKKLLAQKVNFSFPFSDSYSDTVVWGTLCFRKVADRVFVQAYGEPLHFIFIAESTRTESRDATYKKTKDLVESLFGSDQENEVLKIVKVIDPNELKYFDECKKVWEIKWPRLF